MSYNNPSRKYASRLSTPVRLGVAAVAACFISAPVLSLPLNPAVVNGAASFNQAGKVLTVTNSNGAIINWQKFSIQAGETTHFAQTSASSSVLNRVLNDPTAIYGTLSSNGRVWLVNPAGIMVGPGGRVDVAGFVASTLNIRNEDFLAGRSVFINDGTAKNVINQGEIRTPAGGSVYLIGSNVSNEGIITTPQGETILAAGATVSLVDSATPGVKVDITGSEGNATNLGTLTAEAGRIGIAGVIVRNSGTVNASSVVSEGGRVFLKASQDAYVDGNGRIVTTGTRGGRIEVLGGMSEGTAQIDGTLDASATGQGDGGFVETSAARVQVADTARVTTLAPQGQPGTWLIDPKDFTIASDLGDMTGSAVVTALNGGHFTIQSSTGLTAGNGDIFVNDAIAKTGITDTTLTLEAQRSIEINAPISSANSKLNVNLQARATNGSSGNVGIFAAITTQGGDLWVGGGSVLGGTGSTSYAIGYGPAGSESERYGILINGATISTGGGKVTMLGRGVDGATVGDANGIALLSGSINAGGGDVLLTGIGGNNPTGETSGVYIGGTVQTSGSGNITITGTGGSNTSTFVPNRGVRIDGGTISSEDGLISITGTGSDGHSSNVGILIDPSSTIETTGNGSITLTGSGGGSSDFVSGYNVGILIGLYSTIETTGSGSITLTGVGGGDAGENHGIAIDGGEGGSLISSYSGNVSLYGTAGEHTDSEAGESSAIRVVGGATLSATSGWLKLESQGGNIKLSTYQDWWDPVLSAPSDVVELRTRGDDVSWTAYDGLGGSNVYIYTTGKNADTAGEAGGHGGKVTLKSLGSNVTIGGINADGGKGGWGNATVGGGKGGTGGEVMITASNGTISVGEINANGGGYLGNANSEGGYGGSITLDGRSLFFGILSARGGDGGEGNAFDSLIGGAGGKGGSISLTATNVDIDFSNTSGRTLDARGGQGGWGGNSGSTVYGATMGGRGGDGGKVVLLASNGSILAGCDDSCEGEINASGGNGGWGGNANHSGNPGGNGGYGGDAGSISLTGKAIVLGDDQVQVLASGGGGGEGGFGYNLPPLSNGGTGGNDGHAGNLVDESFSPIPNIVLVATYGGGVGIRLGEGSTVESMGGMGSNGWTHMESQAGVYQPINDGWGGLRTGRLTFLDVGGIVGNVRFLGQSNIIDSVSGYVTGDFTFDGRGNSSNYSELYNIGESDRPLTVDGNLLVHSTWDVGIYSATVTGFASVLSESSIDTYAGGSLTAAEITIVGAGDTTINGKLSAAERIGIGAGLDPSTGTNPSGYGGNISFGSSSIVESRNGYGGDVITVVTRGGTGSQGNIFQASGARMTAAYGGINILAYGDAKMDGTTTITDAGGYGIYVAAGASNSNGMGSSFGGGYRAGSGSIVSVGVFDAIGGTVAVKATGPILRSAGNPDSVNIFAETVSLTSFNGRSSAGGIAISAFTEATGSITAEVGYGGAIYGGISIQNFGAQPGSISLTDKATNPGSGLNAGPASISFYNAGNLALDGTSTFRSFNSGDIAITSGGNLAYANAASLSAPGNNILLGAKGNLTMGVALAAAGNLGLSAGSILNINNSVSGSNVTLLAPTIDIGGTGSVAATADAIVLGTQITIGSGLAKVKGANVFLGGGNLSLNGEVTTPGQLEFNLASVNASSGGSLVGSSPTSNITGIVSGNITLDGGARFAAGGDIDLTAAVISLNNISTLNGTNLTLKAPTVNIRGGSDVFAMNTASVSGSTINIDGALSRVRATNVSFGGTAPNNTGNLSLSYGGAALASGQLTFNLANVTASNGGHLSANISNPNSNITGTVSGNITLDSGAWFEAGNDIRLTFTGGASTISTSHGSYLVSDTATQIPATIYLDFLTGTGGGVFIDGTATTTSLPGGSGFFVVNTSTPAVKGAGLDILYGGVVPPPTDTCATNPALCPPADTCATNPALCPPPIVDLCASNPELCKQEPEVDPCTSSPDLCKAPSPITNPISLAVDIVRGDPCATAPDSAQCKASKPGEKEKKEKDSFGDEADDGKKDDKSAQKKVAQCGV